MTSEEIFIFDLGCVSVRQTTPLPTAALSPCVSLCLSVLVVDRSARPFEPHTVSDTPNRPHHAPLSGAVHHACADASYIAG